jgi:hypothetical protein
VIPAASASCEIGARIPVKPGSREMPAAEPNEPARLAESGEPPRSMIGGTVS